MEQFRLGDRVRIVGPYGTPSQRSTSWIVGRRTLTWQVIIHREDDHDCYIVIKKDHITKTSPLELLAAQAE